MTPPVITRAAPADAAAWDRYVDASSRATPYHLFAWHGIFQQGLQANPLYLVARRATGSICGVLPMVQLRSMLFGNFLVSVPYANFGGALADEPAIEDALMRAAGEAAQGAGATHIEFRDTVPRPDWPVRTDKVEMRLPLPGTEDELWKSVGAKIRAQVKRPLREGATVVRGGAELLDDFHHVFAMNMRDLGTPVHSKAFFRRILAGLPGQAELVIVRLNGEPAAAGLLVHYGKTTEIPSASSLRSLNRYGVNMLLYWECLRSAISRGATTFDFGRSSPDSGTYRFKKQWGAVPHQLYWHYWLGAGQSMPNLSPSNSKYALAIRAWSRLPLWMTKLAGPLIVRRLP
jgi:FemAB-related protein (PEP-CTERM system-associated)